MIAALLLLTHLAVASDLDGASPEELLDDARSRAMTGDYEGTRILAQQALDVPGEHQTLATYLIGLGWEYDGQPERAVAIYDDLLAQPSEPVGITRDDVVFRRAEALGRMGDYRAAQKQLDALGDPDDRRPGDRTKILVLEGLWNLERGKDRKGLLKIAEALATAEADDSPRYQAMARGALIEMAITAADAIAFKGSDRKKQKQFAQRQEQLSIARDQLAATIPLDNVRWTLQGLLLLGHGFESFGDAMLAETPVKKLTEDQLALNRQVLAERVEAIWIEASRYYDRGLSYAHNNSWSGTPTPQLADAHRTLQSKIETGPR